MNDQALAALNAKLDELNELGYPDLDIQEAIRNRAATQLASKLGAVDYAALDDAGKKQYQRSSMRLAIAEASTSIEAVGAIVAATKPSGRFKPDRAEIMAAIATGIS